MDSYDETLSAFIVRKRRNHYRDHYTSSFTVCDINGRLALFLRSCLKTRVSKNGLRKLARSEELNRVEFHPRTSPNEIWWWCQLAGLVRSWRLREDLANLLWQLFVAEGWCGKVNHECSRMRPWRAAAASAVGSDGGELGTDVRISFKTHKMKPFTLCS